MHAPMTLPAVPVHHDIHLLPSYLPVPGAGILPVNTFVIRDREPVLIDTGPRALRDGFLKNLESVVDPADLRWIWITHTDADHVGNLDAVLERAPRARVVTTFLGMAKLGLLGLPTDRVFLLNPGQTLDVGGRKLLCTRPPTFDAPETTALFDARTGTLFSADSLGALMQAPAETAAAIPAEQLREGLLAWAMVDAPWLPGYPADLMGRLLDRVREHAPSTVLSSHLPPAFGMTDTLLGHLSLAPGATAFVGPDQAALEMMMAAAG